ncbi:MAG: iron-containing alcohol dehydrogenase [Lactobacillaceae bacterium]|jgi:alcohol dehydrogenase YqhD (iron-dependent ADH family)|nr:iron-containing alcohol dehydrogenase [Lactobacillaceae bacterium]
MQSFIFHNPTKIIFGNNTSSQLGENAKYLGKKALFIYGRDSIKKSGLYDNVVKQLNDKGIAFVEHGGVKSNPTLEHTRDGVKKVKENNLDCIIAVGGGSVLDEAKAISGAAGSNVDAWDIFTGKETVKAALPIGTILTIPATGSEMNAGMVITNTETKEKLGAGSPHLFPKFSILDPILTYTIPETYTSFSSVDMVSHLTESYFTHNGGWTPIQASYVEGLVKTIIEATARILKNPEDNEARATMMWAGSLAWNGLNTAGVGPFIMACHTLEHPISAVYDIAHGAGLSIVTPSWLKFNLQDKCPRIARFARNVFGVEGKDDKPVAEEGIKKLREWYKSIKSPTTFAEAGINNPDVELLVRLTMKAARMKNIQEELPETMVRQIYKDCL